MAEVYNDFLEDSDFDTIRFFAAVVLAAGFLTAGFLAAGFFAAAFGFAAVLAVFFTGAIYPPFGISWY